LTVMPNSTEKSILDEHQIYVFSSKPPRGARGTGAVAESHEIELFRLRPVPAAGLSPSRPKLLSNSCRRSALLRQTEKHSTWRGSNTTLPARSKRPAPYVWGTGTGSASPTDQGCVGSRADCRSALNRKRGPPVRQFHWSERNLNRRRVYCKKVLGSVGRYADQAAARCAVTVFLAEINSEKVRITI
jgi:hypothetical protein